MPALLARRGRRLRRPCWLSRCSPGARWSGACSCSGASASAGRSGACGVRGGHTRALPLPGRACLRGHTVPRAGRGSRDARGAPPRRGAAVLVLLGLADCCARRRGCALCGLPRVPALRGSIAGACSRAWGAGGRRASAAVGGRGTSRSPVSRCIPSPSRATPRTRWRPKGIENVPGIVPRRLGEILRWVPLVGGTIGFFLALRFARARPLCPAALAVPAGSPSSRIGIAGLLLGRYLFLPAAMLSIFFGFAALGWLGIGHATGFGAGWVARAAVLAVAFVGLDDLASDRPPRPAARRGPATRRDPGRPAGSERETMPQRAAARAVRAGIRAKDRPVPILSWYLDRPPEDLVSASSWAPRQRMLVAPNTDEVAEKFVLDPRDPKRFAIPRQPAWLQAGGGPTDRELSTREGAGGDSMDRAPGFKSVPRRVSRVVAPARLSRGP